MNNCSQLKLATHFLHPLIAVLNLLFRNFPSICWHKQEKYKNQRKILAKGVANAQISWNLVRKIYRDSWLPKCILDYLSSEIYANVRIIFEIPTNEQKSILEGKLDLKLSEDLLWWPFYQKFLHKILHKSSFLDKYFSFIGSCQFTAVRNLLQLFLCILSTLGAFYPVVF